MTVRKSKYSWDKCFGNWVCSTMQNVVVNPAKGWEILVTYTKKPHQIERGCLGIREDQPKIRQVYRGVLLRFDLWHNWRWAFPATVWCFRGSQTLNTNTSCVLSLLLTENETKFTTQVLTHHNSPSKKKQLTSSWWGFRIRDRCGQLKRNKTDFTS